MKYLLLVLISFVFSDFFRSFFSQVMLEGEHSGVSPHGDISIDDVSFTPECRPALHGTVNLSSRFRYQMVLCATHCS